MNPERWRRIEELYLRVRDEAPADTTAFLSRECAGDAELAREVERLLAADPKRPNFIEPPTALSPHSDADHSAPPDADSVAAGRVVGDFELLEELPGGGMGVVFRARQRSLERDVAVKFLRLESQLSRQRVTRFEREARAMAKLQHPHIVKVFAVGEEAGARYIAMELVRGPDLAREIDRLRRRAPAAGVGLPDFDSQAYLGAVARLVEQAADALAYAHAHGVIHRDVKPHNILVDLAGDAQLVDFGLARDESLGAITATHEQGGTPYYMSPEQVRASLHQVDHRTDVYSLGVVLYELLTLRRPFEGSTSMEVLQRVAKAEPPPPPPRRVNPRVARDLDVICATAMAHDLADRYASAATLRDDLRRFLRHEAIQARPAPLARRTLRWIAKRRRSLAAGLVGGACVLALALALRESELAPLRTMLRATLERGKLADRPLHEQAAVRAAEQRLSAAFGLGGLRDRELLMRARSALEQRRDDARREVTELVKLARDPALSESARDWWHVSAIQRLSAASFLFGDDPVLSELSNALSLPPRLSVRATDSAGRPLGARVSLREVETRTTAVGPPTELGRAPLEGVPVQPGYYRVVVEFDPPGEAGFRELICRLGLSQQDVELVATRRDDETDLARGMVAFPATSYEFPSSERDHPDLRGVRVELAAFALDPTEVSIGDYRRFVDATGHPAPKAWQFGLRPEHDALPVTGIPWKSAAAYAAWAGKRLPTFAEWQFAARGRDGRLTPWGGESLEAPWYGNVHHSTVRAATQQADWELFVACAAPVRSHPDAATPEGLFHMLGNVSEYTESMAIERIGGQVTPRVLDRMYAGGAWNAQAAKHTLAHPAWFSIGDDSHPLHRGFRCARSLQP